MAALVAAIRVGALVALLPADDESLENVPARAPYHPLGPSAMGLTCGSIFFAQSWIAGSSQATDAA